MDQPQLQQLLQDVRLYKSILNDAGEYLAQRVQFLIQQQQHQEQQQRQEHQERQEELQPQEQLQPQEHQRPKEHQKPEEQQEQQQERNVVQAARKIKKTNAKRGERFRVEKPRQQNELRRSARLSKQREHHH